MGGGSSDHERHTDDGELMHRTDPNMSGHAPGWARSHPACIPVPELLKQCEVGTGRATGGPGGQHRNKVETQVFVKHLPTGIEARADERRSQSENKEMAVRRLRLLLAIHVRTPVPVGEIGSGLWKSRVRGGKIHCNESHDDYPAMLAEAMDVIAAMRWEPSKAAIRLECTPSQLIKLVKDYPAALHHWNAQRRERGEHDLK